MSVQPIEIVDLLSGLEEHRSCEHSCHRADSRDTHADGDEVFVRVNRTCGCPLKADVIVLCRRFLLSPRNVHCNGCGHVYTKPEAYTVLGPANPAA